jgi:hypothetical protein
MDDMLLFALIPLAWTFPQAAEETVPGAYCLAGGCTSMHDKWCLQEIYAPAQQSNTGNPSPIYSVEGGGGAGTGSHLVPRVVQERIGTDGEGVQ